MAAETAMSFEGLGLDPRLLRALAKRGFEKPTPVQAEAIPAALEGRDVVARARTGSGKTLAYLLPMLHRVLASGAPPSQTWQALVLVPTRELCDQVAAEAASLAAAAGGGLGAAALGGGAADATAAVVVSTPARAAEMARAGRLPSFEGRLVALALDEADLLLGYGYEADLQALAPLVPRSCQCMLLSATTSEDVERLTKLVLHSPASLDLLAAAAPAGGPAGASGAGAAAEIEHFRLDVAAEGRGSGELAEKLLRLLALLKYGLLDRKVLIFVNSADAAARTRLFLDAFGLRAAALSADLPLNSRHHILQEFNRGLFDYLVATDDVHGGGGDAAGAAAGDKRKRGREPSGGRPGKRGGPAKKDAEFGVTRGIDFKGVGTVVNLEMPTSVEGYVHRVGRTGRAGAKGTALSLLAPEDAPRAAAVDAALAAAASGDAPGAAADAPAPSADAGGAEGGEGGSAATSGGLAQYPRLTQVAVQGLRYRAEDVARSITKQVIKEARAQALKAELLNSKRLAGYFEERPRDAALLRHDRPLAATTAAAGGAPALAAPHLTHVPAYIRDATLSAGRSSIGGSGGGSLPARKRRKAAAVDPLKGGFVRMPHKGADKLEPMTEMEERALENRGKQAKQARALAGKSFAPKRNVRRNSVRKR